MPSAELFLLNTHIWLDVAVGRSSRSSVRVRRQLEAAANAALLYVAAITPWEVATLARKGAVLVTRDAAILDYALAAKAVRALDPSR